MNSSSFFSIAAAVVVLLGFNCPATVHSAEKNALKDIDLDAMIAETQKTIGSSQDTFNLVWVIPSEFWQASLAQDKTLTELQRRSFLKVFNKYMVVGVVRADISPVGSFRFHDEKTVFGSLKVAYITGGGKRLPLKLHRRVDDNAQLVIESMKPMLRAAMGKMGENFHLFICDTTAGRKGTRVSAYDSGTVAVALDKVGKNAGGTGKITFPLDSLYVPRQCPKCAKRAHISWNYCPWCGTKHEK